MDMRSSHQRAGFLWKLPMSKPSGEKWQKRSFVAKDGYLLYYGANAPSNPTNFDTKPKGVVPLGGSKVEAIERGPKVRLLKRTSWSGAVRSLMRRCYGFPGAGKTTAENFGRTVRGG